LLGVAVLVDERRKGSQTFPRRIVPSLNKKEKTSMAAPSGKKILVVDDEPDAVEFVKTMLEAEGYGVCTAADGAEGLEKARMEAPDLTILDIQMPEKDGFATFADMRKDPDLCAIPVVMLTGVGDRTGMRFSAKDMGNYMGSEPDAYLEKPVDPVLLQETVARILDGVK
jgi:CheY-like chemotaxis protein